MRFQRRGGRKRIVAPDGSEIAPTTKPQPDGTLVKATRAGLVVAADARCGRVRLGRRSGQVQGIGRSYISRLREAERDRPGLLEEKLERARARYGIVG
jgi:hypothetical protein